MTRDEMIIDKLTAFVRQHAPGGCKVFSRGEACSCLLCDIDRLAAALRAPAVTGEAEQPVARFTVQTPAMREDGIAPIETHAPCLQCQVKTCRDIYPGQMDMHCGYCRGDDHAVAVPFEAKTHQYSLQNAVPPAAGAPPALVALVQRWQKARLAVRDAEDHEAYSMAEQLLDIHERALLAWSPAPAPVAPPSNVAEWVAAQDSTPLPNLGHRADLYLTAPVAPPAETRGHQIVARDRDGMPWCETCRQWGVREDGPCDRTYPGTPAPPAVAGGDAPCPACDGRGVYHVEKWNTDIPCAFCWRRRQEGQ